jgi:hypothetical protein
MTSHAGIRRLGPRSGRNGAMQYLGMCAKLDLRLYFQIKGLIRRRGRKIRPTAEFIHKAACELMSATGAIREPRRVCVI